MNTLYVYLNIKSNTLEIDVKQREGGVCLFMSQGPDATDFVNIYISAFKIGSQWGESIGVIK